MPDPAGRSENRNSLTVAVELYSLDSHTPAQRGFTQNVSPRGARVVTGRSWQPNDRLHIKSLRGNLRSNARVVYCQPLADDSFAIGLELVTPAGNWGARR